MEKSELQLLIHHQSTPIEKLMNMNCIIRKKLDLFKQNTCLIPLLGMASSTPQMMTEWNDMHIMHQCIQNIEQQTSMNY